MPEKQPVQQRSPLKDMIQEGQLMPRSITLLWDSILFFYHFFRDSFLTTSYPLFHMLKRDLKTYDTHEFVVSRSFIPPASVLSPRQTPLREGHPLPTFPPSDWKDFSHSAGECLLSHLITPSVLLPLALLCRSYFRPGLLQTLPSPCCITDDHLRPILWAMGPQGVSSGV